MKNKRFVILIGIVVAALVLVSQVGYYQLQDQLSASVEVTDSEDGKAESKI